MGAQEGPDLAQGPKPNGSAGPMSNLSHLVAYWGNGFKWKYSSFLLLSC